MGNLLDRFCIACGIGRIWKDKTDVPFVPVVENTDGGVLVVDSSKKLLRYGIKSAVRSLWYWNVCFVSRHILYFIPIWTAYSVCRGILTVHFVPANGCGR